MTNECLNCIFCNDLHTGSLFRRLNELFSVETSIMKSSSLTVKATYIASGERDKNKRLRSTVVFVVYYYVNIFYSPKR